MPAQEEIEQCIKYLIQENEMMMLGAVYNNVGGAYEEIQKNSGTSEYNEIIYQYYCWGVEATATAIKRLEREKMIKSSWKQERRHCIFACRYFCLFISNETKHGD